MKCIKYRALSHVVTKRAGTYVIQRPLPAGRRMLQQFATRQDLTTSIEVVCEIADVWVEVRCSESGAPRTWHSLLFCHAEYERKLDEMPCPAALQYFPIQLCILEMYTRQPGLHRSLLFVLYLRIVSLPPSLQHLHTFITLCPISRSQVHNIMQTLPPDLPVSFILLSPPILHLD